MVETAKGRGKGVRAPMRLLEGSNFTHAARVTKNVSGNSHKFNHKTQGLNTYRLGNDEVSIASC